MSNQNGNRLESPVLKSAWQRYAEFDANATTATKQRTHVNQVGLSVSVIAVILAVFQNNLAAYTDIPYIGEIIRVILILVLIMNFILIAIALRSQQSENSLELRASAEEIKKEIYLYRSVLQWYDERDHWLSNRLTDIHQRVSKTFDSGSFQGEVPPNYDPDNPKSDPGFTRLWPNDYLNYRLEKQLSYYAEQISPPQRARTHLYWGLFITSIVGMLFAALGGGFSGIVAITLFAAIALMNWYNPKELDTDINTYNQLMLGLQSIRDHWLSLSREAQTSEEFFKLVIATEQVIWSQHNKNASEMWRAIDQLKGRNTNDVLDEAMILPNKDTLFSDDTHPRETPGIETISGEVIQNDQVEDTIEKDEDESEQTLTKEEVALAIAEEIEIVTTPSVNGVKNNKKGLPHAFVVMPFGRKQGFDGRWYDFDAIYYDLIRPALEAAGFESFRADEESVSGDILTDMFQELLLADLVIADMSIDNANVFYELGVRHAMRKRGLVHIQSGRAYMPFDIFNVRTIPYHTDKNGRPDPDYMEKDKQSITFIVRETWASDIDRVHSPIFNLLDGLAEPDRKTLRTPLATGFWREHNEWRERVTIARRQKRIGDILLLTEEISNPLIKEEAIGEAGNALKVMGRDELALQQYRQGIELNPHNIEFKRQEAFHLNRLNRTDESIVKLERLLQDYPHDTEAISNLGKIYKQMWMETWVSIADKKQRSQEAYEASHWLVKSAHTYLAGYKLNQNEYYPGINALSLAVLTDFLATKYNLESDPDVEAIRELLPKLKGAIHFALESITERETSDYWALASLAELEVSISEDPRRVTRAYKRALTAARKNVYNLRSSLSQLDILASIGFRPEFVQAGIEVLQSEISRISHDEVSDEGGNESYELPQVFIFAGHTFDRPNQREQVFPMQMVNEARRKIDGALDKFNAGKNDLAITTGVAAGGDMLFLDACLERGMKVEIYLPFEEAMYIKTLISFAGDKWIERFYSFRNNSDVTIRLQSDHLGKVKRGDNIYERNERWALYSSMLHGIDRMRLILLWDGLVDNTPGGPDNMIEEVRQLGGIAEHLNTTKFDYWKAGGKVSKALDILSQDL